MNITMGTTRITTAMLDDFFLRALAAGIGVALMAGPLGCFVVWRRMAYFGDTMAHSALLGVTLASLLEVAPVIGIFAMATTVAGALLVLQRRGVLSADALLGLLSHGTLAIGLVLIAVLTQIRMDLMALLFGDVLAVNTTDLAIIWGGGAVVLAVVAWVWRPLLADTLHPDLAAAEGMEPERARIVFMLLMALVIAVAMKVVGVLLITALLIIPAAAARRLASTPEVMAVAASLLGVVSVVAGLFGSLTWDTPSGPSIVVAAVLLFLAGLLIPARAVPR
jgi:zinc transport system permease protein